MRSEALVARAPRHSLAPYLETLLLRHFPAEPYKKFFPAEPTTSFRVAADPATIDQRRWWRARAPRSRAAQVS